MVLRALARFQPLRSLAFGAPSRPVLVGGAQLQQSRSFATTDAQGRTVVSRRRDPKRPQSPGSAYNLFCKEEWKDVPKLSKDDGTTQGEHLASQSKRLAAEWKELKESKGSRYNALVKTAASLKEKYKEELDSYESPRGYVNGWKTKYAKPEGQPKRPPNGYMLWIAAGKRAEVAAKHDGGLNPSNIGAISKELGSLWKELSDAEKAPFQEEAKKAKTAWNIEMKPFKDAAEKAKEEAKFAKAEAGLAKKAALADAKVAAKIDKMKADKDAPKPAKSAYLFYIAKSSPARADVVAELPEGHKDCDVLAAQRTAWKSLSDNDKEPYQTMGTEDKARFDKEFQEYVVSEAASGIEKAAEKAKDQVEKAAKKAQDWQLAAENAFKRVKED